MDLKYIDIHSHLNLSPLKERSAEVLAKMRELGVGTITIGVDYATSCEAVELSKTEDFLWAGVGQHPNDNPTEEFVYEKYLELAKNERVVCIGECGLDYFRGKKGEVRARQIELFKKHIELSIEVGKPLMIHARASKGTMDAYEDVIEILKEYTPHPNPLLGKERGLRGNFHFYAGDLETTKKILDLGFTMSFDGPITFARDYDEVIRYIPLDMMHAETDAPFAAPVPYRGQSCEPWMVIEVVKKIAEIKALPIPEVSEALLANARRMFKI